MSFLKAEWRKLALANYEIDPELLADYLPYRTELDLWNDKCLVSLVGFMFLNTRVKGISIPFHRDFEEVNLRFYVRHKSVNGWKRGVVFIKEIVPRPAITMVANGLYHEHYQTMKMAHSWVEDGSCRQIAYRWGLHGLENSFSVNAEHNPCPIEENSETEFITEHYWGYTKTGDTKTLEYEVPHPKWNCYQVTGHEMHVDFKGIYGQRFEMLTNTSPHSVMLAEGSEITVENKRLIL